MSYDLSTSPTSDASDTPRWRFIRFARSLPGLCIAAGAGMLLAGRGDPIYAVLVVVIAFAMMLLGDLIAWIQRKHFAGDANRVLDVSSPVVLDADLVSSSYGETRPYVPRDRPVAVTDLPPAPRHLTDVSALPEAVRWTPDRKKDIALRLLRGERPEAIAREVSMPLFRIEEWRNRALAAVDARFSERDEDRIGRQIDDARQRIDELAQAVKGLEKQRRAKRSSVGRSVARPHDHYGYNSD